MYKQSLDRLATESDERNTFELTASHWAGMIICTSINRVLSIRSLKNLPVFPLI